MFVSAMYPGVYSPPADSRGGGIGDIHPSIPFKSYSGPGEQEVT